MRINLPEKATTIRSGPIRALAHSLVLLYVIFRTSPIRLPQGQGDRLHPTVRGPGGRVKLRDRQSGRVSALDGHLLRGPGRPAGVGPGRRAQNLKVRGKSTTEGIHCSACRP